MADLYIYYQVRDADAAALQPLVRAMQARLGVASQLKRRPQAKEGLQTWMEVYPAASDDFLAALNTAVEQAGLLKLTAGPRHTEIFTDLMSCV